MTMKKRTAEELKSIIPDDDVKAAFMEREDIAPLPLGEQERLWIAHSKRLDEFWYLISRIESVVIE